MKNERKVSQERVKNDSLEKYLRKEGQDAGMSGTVSAQECTGLFAAPPDDAQAYENLRDLHGMETPTQVKR